MTEVLSIRPFQPADAQAIRNLFVLVNRQLAPLAMRDVFEAYIARSLTEEIDRIAEYYAEHEGGFWVACRGGNLLGMFGLERSGPDAMELRRMYVDPAARRGGVANAMLARAELETRRMGSHRLELSTSELQSAAVALYRAAGFRLEREATAESATNKTVGGGIRRFYFAKDLRSGDATVVSTGSPDAV